jgi:hypothetical protein
VVVVGQAAREFGDGGERPQILRHVGGRLHVRPAASPGTKELDGGGEWGEGAGWRVPEHSTLSTVDITGDGRGIGKVRELLGSCCLLLLSLAVVVADLGYFFSSWFSFPF